MDNLYHSLFINNEIEFSYIGAEKPEVEEEIKRLNKEIAEGIRSELKEGDKLLSVIDFLTSSEAEEEDAREKHRWQI